MATRPPKPHIEAPGLIWQPRQSSWTPYWRAPEGSGYKPARENLKHLVDRPEELIARCTVLEDYFRVWQKEKEGVISAFDGTIGSLLKRYQSDPDSPYHALRPGSRHPYDHYIDKLVGHIGNKRLHEVTGIDLKRWHDVWSRNGDRLAASKMARAVLDAAVSYGIMARIPECIELREVLKAAGRKLPAPRRREAIITADQVIAIRDSARADGRPSMALAYALVFETTLRLWDVIGQWWPMDAPLISDIVSEKRTSMKHAKKWFGLRWEDVDGDLVLRFVPSKTSAKTGLAVTFPLRSAPMVMEELAHWPIEKRTGPAIVNEASGLPYSHTFFGELWRKDRKAAGIESSVWARDLRASGISEARAGGVATDDAAKVAGHASTKTTSAVYDRATLEAAERFAEARTRRRASGK